jgi:hypothetical protein
MDTKTAQPLGTNPVMALYRHEGNVWRSSAQVRVQARCSATAASTTLCRYYAAGLMERRKRPYGNGFQYRFLPGVSLEPKQTVPTLEPQITEMYMRQKPVYEIANELGVRYGTLRHYISNWGLPAIRELHRAELAS